VLTHTYQTSLEMTGATSGYGTERVEPFVSALLEVSRLECLCFHRDCSRDEPVVNLAKIPTLKQIRVICSHWYPGKPTRQKLQNAHWCTDLEKLMADDQSVYEKVVHERSVSTSTSVRLLN
jgi:hypothetical protein